MTTAWDDVDVNHKKDYMKEGNYILSLEEILQFKTEGDNKNYFKAKYTIAAYAGPFEGTADVEVGETASDTIDLDRKFNYGVKNAKSLTAAIFQSFLYAKGLETARALTVNWAVDPKRPVNTATMSLDEIVRQVPLYLGNTQRDVLLKDNAAVLMGTLVRCSVTQGKAMIKEGVPTGAYFTDRFYSAYNPVT